MLRVRVPYLCQWSKAVGSATCIGDNVKVWLVFLFINTHNEHWSILTWSWNYNLLCTTLYNNIQIYKHKKLILIIIIIWDCYRKRCVFILFTVWSIFIFLQFKYHLTILMFSLDIKALPEKYIYFTKIKKMVL